MDWLASPHGSRNARSPFYDDFSQSTPKKNSAVTIQQALHILQTQIFFHVLLIAEYLRIIVWTQSRNHQAYRSHKKTRKKRALRVAENSAPG